MRGLLRFNTCGSVDDGKSTLMGRLLFDSKRLFDDQLAAFEADSKKLGSCNGELDFALLLDGLIAEREQGITIDVAYRFFSTDHRNFIVADTPGHEQYTRNMVTGASTAALSVILVDASRGVLTQTRRHTFLVALLGVKHVVLVVNKLDLVEYAETVFRQIESEYRAFAEQAGLSSITCIPISATRGDNVVTTSQAMPWYQGPSLLQFLDGMDVGELDELEAPFRLPVQWVNRPHSGFRGFAGTVAAGRIRPGDAIRVQPAGKESRVARIVTLDGDLEEAVAGQAITLTLEDEIDVSRGDVLCLADSPAQVADRFEATIVWMSETPLMPGRSYVMKLGTTTAAAYVLPLKSKMDIHRLEPVAANQLELNEIGVCELELDRMITFEPYRANRRMGGFILIDRVSCDTVGAGMISHATRRSQDVHWQAIEVSREARARMKGQKPRVLWYTGLSGAGKSTIANLVDRKLHSLGRHSFLLDGDNVRHGLSRDLGFSDQDRVENIRRIAEVAKLMAEAGLIVGVAFISPFRSERRMARALLAPDEFVEIFVDAPLSVAESRDPKGLYKKARAGQLKHFTGIDSPYETPEAPELRIDTEHTSPEAAAETIVAFLAKQGVLEFT